MREQIDVAIIGGGPAGLSAAIELKRFGVKQIIVLERESEAGGIPRHCGHYPFGMREYKQLLTGTQYAKKLVRSAIKAGVNILTSTSVIEVKQGGTLAIVSNQGMREISAKRVIYATGVRETPRAARLVSGSRPLGVINTGALQAMVFLEKQKPFERPVIIGSELVAFSAIQTCKHAKISPVAMIEEAKNVTAQWPIQYYTKLAGLPLHLETKLTKIISDESNIKVSAIEVENSKGEKQIIECDGVIFTGQFTPEASLARCGHLQIDDATNGPIVDQYGRCSDPVYFAAGNILRPVETSGWSWNEGRQIGHIVANDLAGKLPSPDNFIKIITASEIIKYAMPHKLSLDNNRANDIKNGMHNGMKNLQLRFTKRAKGYLVASINKKEIYRKKLTVFPEKRVLIPMQELTDNANAKQIILSFEEI